MKGILVVLFTICSLLHGNTRAQSPAGKAKENDSTVIASYKDLIKKFSADAPDSAEYYGHKGLQYALDHKYVIGEAAILEQLGNTGKEHGQVDIAKKRLQHALAIYRQLKMLPGQARTNNSLGAIEASAGNYDVAAKYFFTTLKIHDSITDNNGKMLTYLNLGSLYLQQNDPVNARKYLEMARQTGEKMALTDGTISVYNTLGILAIAERDSAKGLQLFTEALSMSDTPAFTASHIECLSYLGRFYLDKGEINKALQYLKEGLALAEKRNLPELQSDILMEIGQIMRTVHPQDALPYLKKAETIGKTLHNRPLLVIVYEEIAALLKEQGNYKEALATTELKQKIADSVLNVNMAAQVHALTYEYELEEQNERISDLEEVSKTNELERNIFIVIALAIVIILGILLVYFQRSRKLNRQLRLRKEELKALNDMKDKLFSVIGHDLRSPLASIPQALDIYEDESTGPDERKEIISSMKEHAKVSLETLDKLLYWGQSQLRGNNIRRSNFFAKGYVKETTEFKKMAAAEKHITVTDNTPSDIQVHADPTHFDFIVRNLLANAIKYTRSNGAIVIDADTRSRTGYVIFSVKDNGIGMSKETLSRLFMPVSSAAGTANEKGNGIGLMLCREFAIQNDGDIWVESEPGKGSAFYFSVKKAL